MLCINMPSHGPSNVDHNVIDDRHAQPCALGRTGYCTCIHETSLRAAQKRIVVVCCLGSDQQIQIAIGRAGPGKRARVDAASRGIIELVFLAPQTLQSHCHLPLEVGHPSACYGHASTCVILHVTNSLALSA